MTGRSPDRDDRDRLKYALLFMLILSVCLLVEPYDTPPFEVCVFKNMTNLPCPGCGLTRSFLYLGHLRIWDSLRMNPFGIVLFAFWGWATVKDVVWVFWRKRVPFLPEPVWSRGKTVFIVAMLVFGLARIVYYADQFDPMKPLKELIHRVF